MPVLPQARGTPSTICARSTARICASSTSTFIVHPQVATTPALAACAANHQNKFRELAELLWIEAFDARNFDQREHRRARERSAPRHAAQYQADVAGTCPHEVKAEKAAMTKFGVDATPSFFINGRYLAGALPNREFAALIDEELAKANAAMKGGVKPEQYYDSEIVAQGPHRRPVAARLRSAMGIQRSQSIFERAKQVIPGGVNSPVRACRSVGVDPVFVAQGDGAYDHRRRRQPLHRSDRQLGPADPRPLPPRDPRRDRRGDGARARRSARRPRSRCGSPRRSATRIRRWRWCARCRRAPRRR